VLLQDGVGGLQVLHESRWVDVEPIPGALIVNISDLLQVCSSKVIATILFGTRG
jgi:isopenicillin N synthase-like dioxygenase